MTPNLIHRHLASLTAFKLSAPGVSPLLSYRVKHFVQDVAFHGRGICAKDDGPFNPPAVVFSGAGYFAHYLGPKLLASEGRCLEL